MIRRARQWARLIKRDVHAIYLAARDPRVPWHTKTLALIVAGYALSPLDLIPDFIPILGLVDDVIIVPLGIIIVIRLIPAEILAEHRATAERQQPPANRAAAIVVVTIWIAGAIFGAWLGYQHFAG